MPGCQSLGSSRLIAMGYLMRSILEYDWKRGRPEKVGLSEIQ